jgi:transcriptional regulator with XRE-family HTH domain
MINWGNVEKKMEIKGWDNVALANELHISPVLISRWKSGKNEPKAKNKKKLIDIFGEDILTVLSVAAPEAKHQSPIDQSQIEQIVKAVCDKQYAELRGFVEGFLRSGKLPEEVVSLARKIVDQHPDSCENCGNLIPHPNHNGLNRTRSGQ